MTVTNTSAETRFFPGAGWVIPTVSAPTAPSGPTAAEIAANEAAALQAQIDAEKAQLASLESTATASEGAN